MTINLAQAISLVVGVVLPLITAWVTRLDALPRVRAIVLLVLSAATSFLTELAGALTSGEPFNVGSALLGVLGTFVVGVGAHFGLWQALGVSDKLKSIGGFIGGAPAGPTKLA